MSGHTISHRHTTSKPTLDTIKRFTSVDEIRHAISHVFQDAQLNLSGHRKLVVVMKNIFNKAIELNCGDHFAMYFTKSINKTLPLKKGEVVADRIAKFCSSFVASISKDELTKRQSNEQENEKQGDGSGEDIEDQDIEPQNQIQEEEEDEEETHVGSFIKYLIHHLLRGIEAKDKNVRYRVVQILAYLVYYIGEIDHDTFEALYTSLNRRLQDKESTVRIQAVVAISRFQSFNFDFEEDENPFTIPLSKDIITGKLTSTIQVDESAEVRRAALLNLSKNQDTIPYFIERARDTNSINRRLVFSRISRELGDFKNIDFDQREHLLKWGLNDREEAVRNAAVKMLNKYWFDAANEDILELIDILRVTDSKIADTAMSVFFKGREDKLSNIKIDEAFWKALTVDKAFLMRTFYYHCNENNLYDLIDSNFPEPIELARTLEKYLQLRIRFLSDNSAIVKVADDHETRIEFIKSQLFTIENVLVKIKFEVEIYKKNQRELAGNLEDYEELAALVKKRKSRLAAGNEKFEDIVTEENEQIVQQLLEFSEEELSQKHKEIKESIKLSKSELKELQKVILDCESKFKAGREKYHALSQEEVDEKVRFGNNDEEYLPFADELKDLEFIIEQLLLVSREFDFSDEIGRRKMLQIIRKSLTEDKLSTGLISIGLQVLRKISINEKDFISMSTEIITDIRDSYESEDETFHSAISGFDEEDDFSRISNKRGGVNGEPEGSEEEDDDDDDEDDEDEDDDDEDGEGEDDDIGDDGSKKHKLKKRRSKKRKTEPKLPPDEIVIRCLRITQNVLELIEEPLENHISLGSIYSGLVNYAINHSEKYTLHLQGLVCLGLFALIDKSTAQDAVSTLFAVMRNSGEDVRVIGMKAIIDILSTYGTSIMDSRILYQYGKLFYKSLNSFDMPKLQCVVAEGLCKLFLADVFNDKIKPTATEDGDRPEFETEKQLFEALVLSYFHPLTQSNQELRQILAFCIPVYAFSHPNHQFRLASVSGDCLYRMFNESSDFLNFESKLSPLTVIQQLVHWCDPNNLVNMTEESIRAQTSHVWQSVYFLQVVEQDTPKNVKRAILNNLGKFYITEDLDTTVLKGLVDGIAETRVCFEENSSNPEFSFDKLAIKNFDGFESMVKEVYEKAIEREAKKDQSISRTSSRATSVLHEMEDSKTDILEKNSVIEENPTEDPEENDEEMAENEESQKGEEKDHEMEEVPDKKQDIDADLKQIDDLLEEEEEVDYDISMADV